MHYYCTLGGLHVRHVRNVKMFELFQSNIGQNMRSDLEHLKLIMRSFVIINQNISTFRAFRHFLNQSNRTT